MDKWQTFGHQNVKEILNKQLKSENFPHAYLFFGQKGLGKKTLALEFAKKILKTEKLDNHPDFQILDTPDEITVEPMQKFMSSLGFKPFLGAKKVAVINNAQNLNKTSANALLKTLEEPSQSTILVLIANSGNVLPTIVSRCQVFNFGSFNKQTLAELAKEKSLTINEQILELALGSSSRLIKLVTDADFYEAELSVQQKFNNLKKMGLAQKFLLVGELAENETPDLIKTLEAWTGILAGELDKAPQSYLKVQALIDAVNGIKQNFNKKLVLQGLMQKL